MSGAEGGRLAHPNERVPVPMRDGARLDTCVWLPGEGAGPWPAILIRTPYSRAVSAVNDAPLLRYLEAGLAVVIQQIRGVGQSEGTFAFMAPHERDDGYDTVEWIAVQPWCNGAVGLDGHSYAGMTQLPTALARPPHLRCMAPAVVSMNFFLEPPYVGGVFSRMHSLVWCESLNFSSMLDEREGAFAMHGFLTDPALLASWLSRPVRDAGRYLPGALGAHYQDVLDHPTFDDWWAQRTFSAEELASITVPTLVVSGNFDPSVGAMALWRGLEGAQGSPDNRWLLIGPWDHNASYNGGGRRHGPYDLGPEAELDLVGLRIAFFRHFLLDGQPDGRPAHRVTHFVTGANRWVRCEAFPPPGMAERLIHLTSGGHANSARGDGRLLADAPAQPAVSDTFVDDPDWPIIAPLPGLKGPETMLDLREMARNHDVLVYRSGPLASPLTMLGEPVVELAVSTDVPDADVIAYLAEETPAGGMNLLAFGQLRLRYREGFHREVMMTAGEVVPISFTLSHLAHEFAAGNGLCLLLAGGNFPLLDPNPHGEGPIADQTETRPARQTIHHGGEHRSVLRVLTGSAASA